MTKNVVSSVNGRDTAKTGSFTKPSTEYHSVTSVVEYDHNVCARIMFSDRGTTTPTNVLYEARMKAIIDSITHPLNDNSRKHE